MLNSASVRKWTVVRTMHTVCEQPLPQPSNGTCGEMEVEVWAGVLKQGGRAIMLRSAHSVISANSAFDR